MKKLLTLVIPCYNEEDNVENMYLNIGKYLEEYSPSEAIFINDGSSDQTIQKIKKIAENDSRIKYLSFSRNFGHQNAVKAGMDFSSGDVVISMDADMQHPPQIIPEMISLWKQGFDIVFTMREEHDGISFFKKYSSNFYYKIVNLYSDVQIVPGASDFRLMDRKVVDAFKNLNENYIFLRGMINWLGFKQTYIKYKANERYAGESKYSIKKMIHLATSGMTSFSIKPLHLSIYIGLFFAAISFVYMLYALITYFFTDNAISGWASTIISILFIGGLNLLMLGIIGEYIGKLFIENKRRPNYVIQEKNI